MCRNSRERIRVEKNSGDHGHVPHEPQIPSNFSSFARHFILEIYLECGSSPGSDFILNRLQQKKVSDFEQFNLTHNNSNILSQRAIYGFGEERVCTSL